MVNLTDYFEAQEQKIKKPRLRSKYASQLYTFQSKCGRFQLEQLEQAKDYYDSLCNNAQRYIRNYRASNGGVDLIKVQDNLKRIFPSGMAKVVAKTLLESWLKGAITLSKIPDGKRGRKAI